MTNFTAARTGNISGDQTAIFQKMFPGEILVAFKRANFMDASKQQVRTIQHGKSAGFPAHGRLTAAYHTVGNTLVGQSITNGERLITIDGVLVADAFHADIDEAMAHYDQRSVIATELGEALARTYDLNSFRTLFLAARATDTLPDGNTGARIQNADLTGGADMSTVGTALAEAVFKAGISMDEKFVPDYDDRWAAFKPAQYALLAQTTAVINKDWNGAGSYADGTVHRIGGVKIAKTNNLPTTDESADGTVLAKYRGDWRNVKGVVFNNRAVGTVKLMDLSVRKDYMPRELGTFIAAKQATGHGILRGECAVELRTVAP